MRERRRRAGDGEHVGVVLGVGREHERDDLRLVAPAGREQRPDRPIDHAAGEHFLLGRLAFALEEAAGDAARRVGVFAVVDRQRQEVDAFARVRRVAGGDEHHRVAEAHDDRAVGLLGQLAGFEGDGLGTDGDVTRVHSLASMNARSGSRCGARPATGVCARTRERQVARRVDDSRRGRLDQGRHGRESAAALRQPTLTVSLFANAEAADQLRVARRVFVLQVVEQPAALADQLQQAAA